jgi:uncharacterized membrane protein
MTAESTARAGVDAPVVPPPRNPQTDEADERRPGRRRLRWLPRYTWSGTLGALLFGCASLTPSLLPRGWVLQGLISGITAAIGYGLAVTVAWSVAELTESRMSHGFRRRAWQVLAAGGVLLCVVLLWLAAGWQRDIHELMRLKAPAGYKSFGIVVLAVLVCSRSSCRSAAASGGWAAPSSGCSAGSSRAASPGRSASSGSPP